MTKNDIRQCAVAGTFYPADPVTLRKTIQALLTTAQTSLGNLSNNANTRPKAIIAPHAGYIYSGPIAATAYARVQQHDHSISRVVLLGPSHHIPLVGFATNSAHFFTTPLGNIRLDRTTINRINQRPDVAELDQAHALEHSLEVHLPFLQVILHNFQLVPIVVGDATTDAVSQLLTELWGGPETLIIISSDLSHYHHDEIARSLDNATSKAIESFDITTVDAQHACGYIPIRGLLKTAKNLNMHVNTIDCRNSGDTAGPRDQVVGYGAYEFS
ncbi:MAG: AmmeMemoRadiSam system protein B [Gammaproteobacteria bacterium]|nr:AmmeMemoRadiSam system protein B [Gammaproteobacteria bacterium]